MEEVAFELRLEKERHAGRGKGWCCERAGWAPPPFPLPPGRMTNLGCMC